MTNKELLNDLLDIEVWLPIKDWEGLYSVSNQGRVKSLERKANIRGGERTVAERILKQSMNTSGYYRVALYKGDISPTKSVHRLVTEAFLDNPENKPEVNHIDGIKTNNNLQNLEWCTSKENVRHSFDTGLKEAVNGERQGGSKLKEEDVISIRQMYQTGEYLQKELSELFGVSIPNISYIVRGKSWTHILPDIAEDKLKELKRIQLTLEFK